MTILVFRISSRFWGGLCYYWYLYKNLKEISFPFLPEPFHSKARRNSPFFPAG